MPFDADEDMRIGDELWSMAELFDIPQVALAEEYIAGPEFSAEGVVVDGRVPPGGHYREGRPATRPTSTS